MGNGKWMIGMALCMTTRMVIRRTRRHDISEEDPLTVEILKKLISNEFHKLNNDLK